MTTGFLKGSVQLPLWDTQPRRLLDTIPKLPQSDELNPQRWLEGVTWEPWPCRTLFVDGETECAVGDFSNSLVPAECEPWVSQVPFRISDAMTRSTLQVILEEVGEMMKARYNMQLSAAFAHELLTGDAGGGRSLASVATAPNGAAFTAAASTPRFGLNVLEQEIAERLQGGKGIIHMPPGLLGTFVMETGLRLNASGEWETPAGNLVISDAGYIDPPAPDAAGSASGETSDWIYASGPVFYESTAPMLIGEGSETLKGHNGLRTPWDRNTIVQYLAGYGILVFDACPVTAVKVNYSA